MNPDIKSQWLTALRSGEYGQGRGVLRDEFDNFCCLGVLCDLASQDGVGEWEIIPGRNYNRFVGKGRQASVSFPPGWVLEWAGIDNDGYIGQFFPVDGEEASLVDLNDDGMSFTQIADVIERFF